MNRTALLTLTLAFACGGPTTAPGSEESDGLVETPAECQGKDQSRECKDDKAVELLAQCTPCDQIVVDWVLAGVIQIPNDPDATREMLILEMETCASLAPNAGAPTWTCDFRTGIDQGGGEAYENCKAAWITECQR